MARLKLSKNELKAQRDALKRYQRYLPTLQLKKQQLQVELRAAEQRLARSRAEERELLDGLAPWIELLAEPFELGAYLRLEGYETGIGNVAGVAIPTLGELRFARELSDLFATPTWVDEALLVLEKVVRLRIEREIFEAQRARLAAELRTTSQRVNLFERVKIPECKDAIRRIRIALGDRMTLDVARGKIAKSKGADLESSA
ncbi:MAG: V-type ATP synthase subunit D [Planctomycetes bacterium]|nr:V-type ATP synthase subunit D [Planctomycetota bacterium]